MGSGVTTVCPHCGQETDGALPFCQLCGQRLATDGQEMGLPSWLRPAAPSQSPSAQTGVKPQFIARLVVITPTVTHQTLGREFALDGREVRIGRASSCDINLDGDPLVSRFHALMRPMDGGYGVNDLNSSNGTLVNDQEIHAETLLREGDEVTIGECKLRIEAGHFEINTSQVPQQIDAAPTAPTLEGAFPMGEADSAPEPFPSLFEGATGPMPSTPVVDEPAGPPPPPPPPTPEELREHAQSLSAQLAQQARAAIQEAERYRNALEDARQRVATAQGLQPASDTVTYRGDLAGLSDLVNQVVESPQHLELVTKLAVAAPQLAEALNTLHATEPYAALLGALGDLRKKLDDVLA